MKIDEIENIELKFLDLDDYQELKAAMISAYANMPGSLINVHYCFFIGVDYNSFCKLG